VRSGLRSGGRSPHAVALGDAVSPGRPVAGAVEPLCASAPDGALARDPGRPPVAALMPTPIEKVTTRCGGHYRSRTVPPTYANPTRPDCCAGAAIRGLPTSVWKASAGVGAFA